jgi:predicted nucleic acid-binding protein
MNSLVCVDAGLLIKLVVEEAGSDLADKLWESWILNDVQVIAPSLSRYEVTAVLRKKVYQNQLPQAMAEAALSTVLSLEGIEYVDSTAVHHRAWEIACRLNLPTAYDAHYLALAEMRNCEFWTTDKRLCNGVNDRFPLIHLL